MVCMLFNGKDKNEQFKLILVFISGNPQAPIYVLPVGINDLRQHHYQQKIPKGPQSTGSGSIGTTESVGVEG